MEYAMGEQNRDYDSKPMEDVVNFLHTLHNEGYQYMYIVVP